MPGGNLPPGCEASDIPGNRPEDGKWEALIEGFWSKKGRSEEQQVVLDDAPQMYLDLIDEAIEYGVDCGRIDQQEADAENRYYEEQAREWEKGKVEGSLIEAIEEVAVIAREAYWSMHSDCGSDFSGDECEPCSHYEVCKANVRLSQCLSNLKVRGMV